MEELQRSFRKAVQVFQINIIDIEDPYIQLHHTKPAVISKIKEILTSKKGIKLVISLKVNFS